MPLLWIDRIIGWANVNNRNNQLDVALGFVGKRPKDKDFRLALDKEIDQMTSFLGFTQSN